MILGMVEYGKCPVNLLKQKHSHKLVGECQLAERQFDFARLLYFVRQSERAADNKGYVAESAER